jgi:hypothetical protein
MWEINYKNLGTKVTKIWEQKLQKFQKYENKNFKNLGTKVKKIREQNLGTKISKI